LCHKPGSFSGGQGGLGSISIYDLAGRIIFKQPTSFTKGINLKKVPVQSLVAGTYMVKIEIVDQFVRTEKFVKQ
jgi:Secretion system C-terminal sorting domain